MTQASELHSHLKQLTTIPGVICGAFVNSATGMVLANTEGEWNVHLYVVARGFAQMLRAQAEVALRYETDSQVEAFQITLGDECHVICPLAHNDRIFVMAVGRLPLVNVGLMRFMADEIASVAVVTTL